MKRNLVMLSVAVMMLAGAATVAAEEHEAPPEMLSRAYEIQVKAGHQMEFEKAIKEHYEMHTAADDPWHREVWQVIAGPNMGTYISRTGGHTWASLDEEIEIANHGDHIATAVSPHVKSVSSTIVSWDLELSHWPADMATPKMVEVTTYTLKYDGVADFQHVVKEFHKMIGDKDLPMHYSWGEVVIGGSGPQFIFAIPHDSWADFKPPEPGVWGMFEEVYGRFEAQKMRSMVQNAIAHEENFVAVYRGDLSHEPGE